MRFDVCAHTYDEHAGPQRFFAECVAQFIGAKPAENILELGAGTGALTQWLVEMKNASGQPTPNPSQEGIASKGAGGPTSTAASNGRRSVPLLGGAGGGSAANSNAPLLATDASPTMIERGRLAVPQAQWSVLDAFSQPLPIAALQVSSGLLHWANDPSATLARWKNFLPPGGRMVHAVPCEPCLKEWRALVPESPVPWRSEAEWLKIFERAGLRVARSQSWRHNAVCSSALEMVRGLHRTGVTGRVRVGPARLRQALREYDARHHTAGGVQATWAWLAIEAA
jgi:SAM-dependent methyltransferase